MFVYEPWLCVSSKMMLLPNFYYIQHNVVGYIHFVQIYNISIKIKNNTDVTIVISQNQINYIILESKQD